MQSVPLCKKSKKEKPKTNIIPGFLKENATTDRERDIVEGERKGHQKREREREREKERKRERKTHTHLANRE